MKWLALAVVLLLAGSASAAVLKFLAPVPPMPLTGGCILISGSTTNCLLYVGSTDATAFFWNGGTTSSDPAADLLPSAADGYGNWHVAGFAAVPLVASIATDGTMTITYSPSGALGVGQVITASGVPAGETITAAHNDPSSNTLTGTGGTGTYTVSPAPSVAVGSESMTAAGIPNRCAANSSSCVYATLSPSGGDDTTAINTAIQNCPAGEVVLLTAGLFKTSGNAGVNIKGSGATGGGSCTLRGATVGALLSTKLNKLDGSAYTASTSGTTMTVAAVGTPNTAVAANDYVTAAGLPSGTQVVSQLTVQSGSPGGQLGTYSISCPGGCPASVASEIMNNTSRQCTSGTLTINVDGAYCTDPTATLLVKTDRGTYTAGGSSISYNSGPNITIAPANRGYTTTSYNLASDAVQGSFSVTLSSVPSPAINPGDTVLLDEYSTNNDPNVQWGPGGYFSVVGYGLRENRSLAQVVEVASVTNCTSTCQINFEVPVDYPFHSYAGQPAQLTTMFPVIRGVGIENLAMWGGLTGNLYLTDCAYCWVKGVESNWEGGVGIEFNHAYRSVLRDSFLHEAYHPTPGGGAYMLSVEGASSENLVENNASVGPTNKENVMRGSGGGNVLAYNYMDDSLGDGTSVVGSEAGVNAGHLSTPHLELLEGNYSQNYKADSYWGNSIYITVFRNWLSGVRGSSAGSPSPFAGLAPLGNYVYYDGTHCHYPYGDWSGRQAVDVQGYSFYNNFVGNVLGFSGQTLLTSPYHGENCFSDIQTQFTAQVTTQSQSSAADSANAAEMWRIGKYQASQRGTGSFTFADCASEGTQTAGDWTYDNCAINTITRTGNWDWVSAAEHCYTFGTVTDAGCSGVTVPTSFYLTSRPAFFGTNTWPWVDPTTGTTYTLPAKYCFEHGQMPTCLEGPPTITALSLSNSSFTGGAASGTAVGNITATASDGSTPTLTLSGTQSGSGNDGNSFQIAGTAPIQLKTNTTGGTDQPGTYNICITATGIYANSPQQICPTITATGPGGAGWQLAFSDEFNDSQNMLERLSKVTASSYTWANGFCSGLASPSAQGCGTLTVATLPTGITAAACTGTNLGACDVSIAGATNGGTAGNGAVNGTFLVAGVSGSGPYSILLYMPYSGIAATMGGTITVGSGAWTVALTTSCSSGPCSGLPLLASNDNGGEAEGWDPHACAVSSGVFKINITNGGGGAGNLAGLYLNASGTSTNNYVPPASMQVSGNAYNSTMCHIQTWNASAGFSQVPELYFDDYVQGPGGTPHPSIWSLTTTNVWPPEIDYPDFFGTNPSDNYFFSGGGPYELGPPLIGGSSFAEEAVDVSASTVSWYQAASGTPTLFTSTSLASGDGSKSWYPILDVTRDGGGNSPTFPSTMQAHYVRAYKKVASGACYSSIPTASSGTVPHTGTC